MTYQDHQEKLSKAINSAIKLIPLLKTTKQIEEVQLMIEQLKRQLPAYTYISDSGTFAPPSSSQCIGEGIQ